MDKVALVTVSRVEKSSPQLHYKIFPSSSFFQEEESSPNNEAENYILRRRKFSWWFNRSKSFFSASTPEMGDTLRLSPTSAVSEARPRKMEKATRPFFVVVLKSSRGFRAACSLLHIFSPWAAKLDWKAILASGVRVGYQATGRAKGGKRKKENKQYFQKRKGRFSGRYLDFVVVRRSPQLFTVGRNGASEKV